jgi:hypothetical protein
LGGCLGVFPGVRGLELKEVVVEVSVGFGQGNRAEGAEVEGAQDGFTPGKGELGAGAHASTWVRKGRGGLASSG